jgi:chemotaxis protein methyltransferase CheR
VTTALEDVELELLLEGVHRYYGADFRQYARASLQRRLVNAMRAERVGSLSALLDIVLHDASAMDRLISALSVTVTTMFRDPTFWAAFREKVVPHLFATPFVRIWHAGCSTGEEVYSMAVLLTEEGLYDRCRIYATDMNATAVERARSGIFSMDLMQEYTQNYLKAGGKAAFSEYYSAGYDHAIFRQSLRRNIVFAQHNLATDGSFNEFNVILCRNVMIYFDQKLQQRVRGLLHQSLRRLGILGLGKRELLTPNGGDERYESIDDREQIYRRKA